MDLKGKDNGYQIYYFIIRIDIKGYRSTLFKLALGGLEMSILAVVRVN